MEKIKINKRGQIEGNDILLFVIVAGGLFVLAPLLLKAISFIPIFTNNVVNTGITGSVTANQTANYVVNKTTGLFDTFVLVILFANILLMFISAFLVDIHPAFVVFYIMLGILALVLAPTYFDSVNAIYASPTLTNEVNQLPISQFVINHFGELLLGVIIVTGVIMFAKFKFGGNR